MTEKNESVFDQTEEKEQTTNDEQSVENESVNPDSFFSVIVCPPIHI